ncbi:thiomuracin/GE37468 family thiazolyl RiPP peptide [Nocardia sp. NPDC059195]
MSLNIDGLPMEIRELDVDDLEVESLTAGLGMSEGTPVSCAPCSCSFFFGSCCCSA